MKKHISYTFHLFLLYTFCAYFSFTAQAEEAAPISVIDVEEVAPALEPAADVSETDPVIEVEEAAPVVVSDNESSVIEIEDITSYTKENESEETAATDPIVQGIYEIAAASDDTLILDVKNCTVQDSDSRKLQLFRSLNVKQQKFYVETISQDTFRISVLHSGDTLTEKPGADETADVSMDTLELPENKEAAENQTWTFEAVGDGAYYIRSFSGKYLTLEDSLAYCGVPVILSDYTGEPDQKWIFSKTQISAANTADTDLVNPYEEDGEYQNLHISLKFGSAYESLTAADLAVHMTETEDHQLTLDPDFLTSYLESLAEKYNTQGCPRKFHTSHGNDITLYKGDFGWKLDIDQTKEIVMEYIETSLRKVLYPVWEQEGASFEKGNDIGDSYVEVDLTNQKVWLYKDGEQLLETDCVSGTPGTDRQTPGGVYSIYFMKSPAVLKGADYTSPVEYWMAYFGNIGLHDATWRSEFGGDLYKTDGSHGCVNLPTDAAKLIYETVDYGYPVVSYY